jgi:hypothetical protein
MNTTWWMRVLLIMSKLSPHGRMENWSKLTWKIGRRSRLRPRKLYIGQKARKWALRLLHHLLLFSKCHMNSEPLFQFMIPFRMRNCLRILIGIYLDMRTFRITISVGKIYSLWSKKIKDWCFKFKLKGQRVLSALRMWIPLAWQIPHILTKWVNFIGSSTCNVRSSPPSGQGTWSPSKFIFSIVVSFWVYIFTKMCCTLLVFGWSITLFFRIYVFAIKFGGMICPISAHLGIPILLLLCSVLYTY